MSSPLKKKKKDQFAFVQSRYRKSEAKEDKAILDMNSHMQYMVYLALYDVLGFKVKRLKKFYDLMQGTKVAWAEGRASTEGMIKYCDQKNIGTYAWMKSIPQKTKFALAKQKFNPQMLNYIEASMLIHICMMAVILKENWNISNAKINQVLDHVRGSIDCYTTNQPNKKGMYLTDADIEMLFRDELRLDLETGEMLPKEDSNEKKTETA